jgi:hypothetical protein
MVPTVADPPGVELTDHVTSELDVPATLALKLIVEFARRLAEAGATVTVTEAGCGILPGSSAAMFFASGEPVAHATR